MNLAKASFSELTQVKGIGESKAKATKSAFLLAQRLAQESLPEAPLLDTPERVAADRCCHRQTPDASVC